MSPGGEPVLVGRERELVRVTAFVSAMQSGPCGLVVSGDAGIGKTSLWRRAVGEAAAAGLTVLQVRCVEAELPLGMAGLWDLLRDVLPATADWLPDDERAVLSAAVGLGAASGASDSLAVPQAFLSLVDATSRRGPVLLAVDDAQWLDAASARILGFAIRRLHTQPVGVLVTRRRGYETPPLFAAADGVQVDDLALGPLSLGALAQVVRSTLGVSLPRPTVARVHQASGGNPMFALEFARAALQDRHPRLGPLPVPSTLQALVDARVDRYPHEVRQALAAVAATDRPTLARMARLDPTLSEALDAAADDGALVIEADGVIRFGHPLVGSTAYDRLPRRERRRLHALLAETTEDVEERSRHLALATVGPDEPAAEALAEAARLARARGAADAAVALAAEALRLTPASSPERVARELAVAEHVVAAGRTAEAKELLDRLLDDGVPAWARVRARVLRSGVEHDVDAAHGELADLLAEAGHDPRLRAEIYLRHSTYLAFRDELESSEENARQALEAARGAGDPGLEAIALARVGDRVHDLGRPEPALLTRAIELADRFGTPQPFVTPRCTWAEVLLRDGDLDAARDGFATELVRALRAGDEPLRGRILVLLSDVEWRAGHWDTANGHLEEVWQLVMDAGGDVWEEGEIVQRRARLAALRGQVDRTRALANDCAAHASVMNWPLFTAMNDWVLGFLEMSLGEHARAWHALESVTRIPTYGRPEVLEALADGIDALVALGRSAEADVLQARLERSASSGHRWATAAASRGAAALLLSRGEAKAAFTAAREAADRFQAAGFPLDEARSHLVAGDALRRLGERRRAGDQLDAAMEGFRTLGATLWTRQAEDLLRRVRPRPRRDGDLTGAERRVAAEVASGKTNREVAAALFTSVATVEAHLTRTYSKLGIRSRTELTRRVVDGSLSLADEDMSGFP